MVIGTSIPYFSHSVLATVNTSIGNSRQWNVANLTQYINTDFDTDTDFFERELLTKDDKFNEYVMTSLRTSWGCDINKIASDYGISYANHFLKNVKKYVESGIMINNNDNYILTDEGMLLADGIASEIFVD